MDLYPGSPACSLVVGMWSREAEQATRKAGIRKPGVLVPALHITVYDFELLASLFWGSVSLPVK